MLAILYLAGMIYFGDRICRYFYRFHSIQQRFATAFLVGLLLSSGISYLGSLAFSSLAQPLIAGNVVFLGIIILVAFKMPRRPSGSYFDEAVARPPGNDNWDGVCLGLSFIVGCWLMWATLSFPDGDFQLAFKSWSDFGANLSVSQSFLIGHNLPSEHPFFPGEPLRYHFLFWFQCANFAFLGLTLVASVNLLSILSLLALLILLMTCAELLFKSRAVSRISVALFFLAASSLSYIPYLQSRASLDGAVASILTTTQFLNSGYPYRGEDWGALTVDIFANQRHLISATGLFFVVFVFLVDLYQHKKAKARPAPVVVENEEPAPAETGKTSAPAISADFWIELKPLLFSGAIIGLLPYWNSAVFVTAFILLGSLFVFFPYRHYLLCLIGMAVVVGLPQLLLLRSGNLAPSNYSFFTWGYIIAQPTLLKVVQYLGWTFGFKWLLLLVALWFLPNAHWRLLLAVSSLLVVVFFFQLSTDAFNNHKLLNIWNIFASLFAAYGLWRIGKGSVLRTALAIVLGLAMTFGSIIDLFPIHNDAIIKIPHKKDRLTNWLLMNTKPSEVFLSHTHLTHPILFTGRKLFLGYTLFAWTAGYKVGEREAVYKQMFQERNRDELVRLLNRNKIAYVCIDNDLRGNNLIQGLNETVYQQNFEKVFEDYEQRYSNLTIYKVPSQ